MDTIETLRADVDALQFQFNVRRQKREEQGALVPWSIEAHKCYLVACTLEDSARTLLEQARGRLIRASLAA